jgi:type IV pilus biogenesis protein CpaD/CtpE
MHPTPQAGVPVRQILLAGLLLTLAGCSSTTKTSTGRTERETDSVIGQSQVPGAPAVRKALEASDSARGRVAAEDSAGMEE